jgi:hypothetical protein
VVEHLDKLSMLAIVWWSALHPHRACRVSAGSSSAASDACRVSC